MITANENVKLRVPVRGTFGLMARQIAYPSTDAVRIAADIYVRDVVESHKNGTSSDPRQIEHIKWNASQLRQAVRGSVPAVRGRPRHEQAAMYAECLAVAQEQGVESDFRAAHKVTHRHARRDLPRPVATRALHVLGR